jgi:hypothetical protein
VSIEKSWARKVGKTRYGIAQLLTRLSLWIQFTGQPRLQLPSDQPLRSERDVAFVITTFGDRLFRYCLPLVNAIRQSGITAPIIVSINGGEELANSDEIRRHFLSELSKQPNTFPVNFRSMVGLSRLWNLGIQIADSEVCVVLNDDLMLDDSRAKTELLALADVAKEAGICVGNKSWSHFAISRQCIRDVGWFDERLLAFGEEDGDYAIRYREVYGAKPSQMPLSSLINVVAPERHELPSGEGKYALVNRLFLQRKYAFTSGQDALLDDDLPTRLLPDVQDYPSEAFRWHYQNRLLSITDPTLLSREIDKIFLRDADPLVNKD